MEKQKSDKFEDIELDRFISVCVQLADCAGEIIRNLVSKGSVKYDMKGDGPVTEADLKIQRTIVYNLKMMYPTLHVRGEESPEMYMEYEPSMQPADFYEVQYGGILQQNHKKRTEFIMHRRSQNSNDVKTFEEEPFRTFSTKNAVVWIDPLDGTNGFVKGRLSDVTCLIGVAINGVSKIGIVHCPYFDVNGDGSLLQGRTFFATEEHGAYYLPSQDASNKDILMARIPQYMAPFDTLKELSGEDSISVVYSECRYHKYMNACMSMIMPSTQTQAGGAGHKCLWISSEKADCYVSYWLAKWDLCAPLVIVNSLGGYTTDLRQKAISFKDEGDDHFEGLIMGKTRNVYNEVINRITKVDNKQ